MNKESNIECNPIAPSEISNTTDIRKAVKLRSEGLEEFAPISIPQFFKNAVDKYGDKVALVPRPNPSGLDENVSFKEYYNKVNHVAKAFIKLGLEERHTVAVLAFNCPEWFYSEMGAIHAGGVATGIYPSSSAEAVQHVLENSGANIVVVDDSKQMEKIRQVRDKLPLLKAAIQIDGPFGDFVENENGYYKWSEVENMNVGGMNDELLERIRAIAINECCFLVYTSGTVGMPKGVMLSHDNISFTVQSDIKRFPHIIFGQERIVSYLPLNHIAAQIVDVFLPLVTGATVYFADKDALKGSLNKTMRTARPTFFGGVPRVFEKFVEKVLSVESHANLLKRTLMSWSRSVILEHQKNVLKGNKSESFQYSFAKNYIAQQVKDALGLDAARTVFTAGAPSSAEMKEYLYSIDIPLIELYGMSENCGAHCITDYTAPDWKTVGRCIPHTEVKIANPDENGYGEICLRGRDVFMGYLGETEKTKETLDDEGWCHSGDLGSIDKNGNVYVSGRLKELVITAGGENIPPVHIENTVKCKLPQLLSNAFLVGDKRKYLTMLVTLKTEMDPETGAPLDSLQNSAVEFLKSELNVNYTTLKEILEAGPCPEVTRLIQNGIDRANAEAMSNAQRVQKFAILPADFSLPTGELGPTLKLKRNVILQKHQKIIESLYK